ncbi:rna-directed dna polymerase from mobile element jockey-like [Willisornis vidua]|uniref:Rna-directed dna polymerase from mobile element jockey-like n=1 Tax=Willisornis vidua TaxID=1566151 RepID=A0ABQ9CS73_9PASS|nr:rna-directed dna polymerase from mobile element jockey-like [Willisornis vidua]
MSVAKGRLENVDPLLNGVNAVVLKDSVKMELLNAFFASVFTAEDIPQETQTLEAKEKVWRKESFPLVEQDWIWDHLSKLDTHKFMDPNGMHSKVLRKLADVIATLLSIVVENGRGA